MPMGAASCWLKTPCWLSHLPLLPTSSVDVARGMGSQATLGPQGAAKPFMLPQQVHGSGQKEISGAREGALACHPHWTLTPLTLVTQGGQHWLSLGGRKQRRPCHHAAPQAAGLDSSQPQAPAAPALPGQHLPCTPLGISRAAGTLAHGPGSGGTRVRRVSSMAPWLPPPAGRAKPRGSPLALRCFCPPSGLPGAQACKDPLANYSGARSWPRALGRPGSGPRGSGGAWGWSPVAPSVLRGLLPLGSSREPLPAWSPTVSAAGPAP